MRLPSPLPCCGVGCEAGAGGKGRTHPAVRGTNPTHAHAGGSLLLGEQEELGVNNCPINRDYKSFLYFVPTCFNYP